MYVYIYAQLAGFPAIREPVRLQNTSYPYIYIYFKNSLIIQEEKTKKNHKRVVSLYVIKNHVNLHKL